MAGSAGIGEGERPYRLLCAGEPGVEKEERREDGVGSGGGGNIAAVVMGVLATDVAGVSGPGAVTDGSSSSLAGGSSDVVLVSTDSASLTFERRREIRGRCEGVCEGVRE